MNYINYIKSDVICPRCLHVIKPKDVKLCCEICETEAVVTAKDKLLRRIPKCTQTGCFGSCTLRKCAQCQGALPADILDYDKYLRFSILGTTGAGKSCFLVTMLHEMCNSPSVPWVLSSVALPKTPSDYQMMHDTLFVKHELLDATAAGVTPPPQLWRIRDRSRMSSTTIPAYSLTIFDGAGEDTMHIDPIISRYIGQSKSLVILVDPLALPGVAKLIHPDILRRSSTAAHLAGASAALVNGLADYVRQSSNIAPGKLIKRDVAIVFTKFDVVKGSFGSNATVQAPSPHLAQQGFVKNDADAVDAEIRDWLNREGETSFLNAVETNFVQERVRFFGVSSFGQAPLPNGKLGAIMPHRVVDPLIWMLSMEGIIPVIE